MKAWVWWAAGAAGAAGIVGLILGVKGTNILNADPFAPGTNLLPQLFGRTPQDIFNAVAAIDPANNPTLQKGYLGQPNWCNRFVHLVCDALGVPLIWGEYGTRANDQISWLEQGNGGWYPVSKVDAQNLALQGSVVLATYKNPNPDASGHMALVLPIEGTMMIAQAGARTFNQGSLAAGFGSIVPEFYAHA